MVWLTIASTLIKLILIITDYMKDQKLIQIGRDQVVAELYRQKIIQEKIVSDAISEVDTKHKSDSTDGAFDPDFERKE